MLWHYAPLHFFGLRAQSQGFRNTTVVRGQRQIQPEEVESHLEEQLERIAYHLQFEKSQRQ
jgi:hypothetical protein